MSASDRLLPSLVTMRALRLEKGMSLRDLAEASGIARGTLSPIERGSLIATEAQARAISDALGLEKPLRTMLQLCVEVHA